MKTNLLSKILILAVMISFSCNNDDDLTDTPFVFEEIESEWARLVLFDDDHIDIFRPITGATTRTVSGALTEGARYYLSTSGQFVVSVERAQNRVRVFDTGIVNHIDHGHDEPARWLANANVEASVPTHFSASSGHMVVFNDGDGTILHIVEQSLETPNPIMRTITPSGAIQHHGAGGRLGNGVFAMTFKDPETPGLLPQMVKFVSGTGVVNETVGHGGVTVTGIHGDAFNGNFGVFGSTDGIILVNTQNQIELIPNIAPLTDGSGNWMGTVHGHDNSPVFFGRSRNFGLFKIDPIAKTIQSVLPESTIAGSMFSSDGKYYIVRLSDNLIKVYDGTTGAEITQRRIEAAQIPANPAARSSDDEVTALRTMSEPSPVLTASDKFLYVLAPNRKQIKVLHLEDLKHVRTFELEHEIEHILKAGFRVK